MNTIEIIVLVLSLVDAICCLICRIPQILRLVKLKKSESISISFWVCNILSCVMCITSYSLQLSIGNISLVIFLCSASCNMVLNIITLILVKKYREKPTMKKEI